MIFSGVGPDIQIPMRSIKDRQHDIIVVADRVMKTFSPLLLNFPEPGSSAVKGERSERVPPKRDELALYRQRDPG
jgi:hypothetical protein